jgi:alpha-glucosidase (family GH31 glycosyl hydrolase)
MEVVVGSDPWMLSIIGPDLHQAEPLAFLTSGRWPPGPLPPGDEDPDPGRDWRRVGQVVDEALGEGIYRATLVAEPAPAGTTTSGAHVEVRLVDGGTVSFSAEVEGGAAVCRQTFVAEAGERFLGFGERSHAVSLEWGVIEHYVGEGPYQPDEYQFLPGTVPPWGLRERSDATYYPVPWLLSTRGYGLLIERDEVSYTRIRTEADDRWSIDVEAGRLDYVVFAGPTPLDALARFTERTGRQPAPERWWFGPWYQSGHANHVPLEEEIRQADVLLGAGAAVSAAETHCRYLPLGADRGFEEHERARTEMFHERGLAVLTYLNPLVGREYEEAFVPAEEAGALLRRGDGGTYLFQAYVGGRQPPHTDETQYDFTHPAARQTWGQVAERAVAAGYDGWMEDFGEYTPLDAVASDGSTGTALHNRYPALFHVAADVAARELGSRWGRRLARFARSGWIGSAVSTPIVWGGDPTTSWGFDGLASAVIEGLTMGASGVAMWGSDVGGFFSLGRELTPELLIRWIQFAAFCPVMRTKAGGIEVPAYRRPQIWDPDILPHWVRWTRWHTRLNDYLMAAHETYRRTGRPIMCALELEHPGIGPVDDQYLLGPDLLVAPVLEPGAVSRHVVVPPGRWSPLFVDGPPLEGPTDTEVLVTLQEIPVFVRAGTVLPLLPDDGRSLSPYASRPDA